MSFKLHTATVNFQCGSCSKKVSTYYSDDKELLCEECALRLHPYIGWGKTRVDPKIKDKGLFE